ncbi:PD40 domain-containing protein [Kineosporia mesophila]|uniref:PD40 domain-containing protein n=1 Tax=Kineosporia mesophila TaxID=566012 RepID=A0ABP6Z012_9ACTN|nr:hypothetical protein [Kineosporia mesophila]MCD5350976.1 hypothetical protein [Kineosporia mesophila]
MIGLAVVVLAAAGLSAVSLTKAVETEHESRRPTRMSALDRGLDLGKVLDRPHIVFRSTSPGPTYGLLAAVPLGRPTGKRSVSSLSCDRVYASATTGICLSANRGAVTTYRAQLLSGRLVPRLTVPISGIPSRVRMSSDGSLGAITTFVSGHSYASLAFSTETTVLETAGAHPIEDLEKTFRTTVDGRVVTASDLNIWGVTFGPGPRPRTFYATAATGGSTWLVRGDLERRTLTSVGRDAECPSLSPDGTTLVYKKRNGSPRRWRYHVLDLTDGSERALPETRSIDDQVAWLDNDHVLYGVPRGDSGEVDVWKASVRNSGSPKLLIRNASSPAVVRAAAH